MARRIEKIERASDDLTGEEGGDVTNVVFALGGEVYEIDLDSANLAEYEAFMGRYRQVARKATKACLLRSLKPSTAGRPRTRQVPAERVRRSEVKETIPVPAPLEREPAPTQHEAPDIPETLRSADRRSAEGIGNSTPEGRFPQQGKESQALLEPGGSPVAPPVLEVLDFSDESDDVPQPWRPCMPRWGEYDTDAAAKAVMWRTLLQAPVEHVTPEIMKDWRGFYQQKVWLRAGQ